MPEGDRTAAQRAVDILHAEGLSDRDIARLIGATRESVNKIRHGHSDGRRLGRRLVNLVILRAHHARGEVRRDELPRRWIEPEVNALRRLLLAGETFYAEMLRAQETRGAHALSGRAVGPREDHTRLIPWAQEWRDMDQKTREVLHRIADQLAAAEATKSGEDA